MSRRSSRSCARLSLETLEDRCTPAAGDFDINFGVNGAARHGVTVTDEVGEFARAVKVGPGGKIYVAGALTTYPAGGEYRDQLMVRRLNSDGSLDRDYAGDGHALIDIDLDGDYLRNTFTSMTVDGQGRVILAGQIVAGTGGFDMAVARVAADGTLDRDFGEDGLAIVWFDLNGGPNDYAQAVAIDGLGRILVSGYANTATGSVAAVGRLTADGDRDTTFGRTEKPGRQWVDYNGAAADDYQQWPGLAVDSNNRVLLGGQAKGATNLDFAAARLTAAGKLDTTFSVDGLTTVDIGQGTGDDFATGLALGPNGTIVLGGTAVKTYDIFGSTECLAAVRLRADGTPDPSFGDNGRTYDMGPYFSTRGTGIDPAGRVILFSGAKIARIGTNGVYDATYGSGGIATVFPVPGDVSDENGDAEPRAMTVAPQGNVLFTAGKPYTQPDFIVVRVIGNDPFPVGAVTTFTADGYSFQTAISNKKTLLYRNGTSGVWSEITGVSAKSLTVAVSGSTVDILVLGTGGWLHARPFFVLEGYLTEYEGYGGWFHFNFGGKALKKYSVGITSGRFQVFALGVDGVLHNSLQRNDTNGYLAPVAFAGSGYTDYRHHRRQDGQIAVFILTSGGVVKRSLANGLANARFTAYPALPAPASGVTVTKFSALGLVNNRLVLKVLGSNGVQYKTTETAANSNTFSPWVVA